MSIEQIIANAEACTIIDDGCFRYPVLTADIEKAGKTKEDLRHMNGEQYTTWCDEVPMVREVQVGTQECIDLCDALETAGAKRWDIGV